MADREILAHDLVRQKDYTNAINEYDSILGPASTNFKTPKDQIIGCLVGRTECYIQLKNYDAAVADCKRLLKLIANTADLGDVTSTKFRIRIRLIHALYKLKRFQEAETACREWINCPQVNADMLKVLERYRTVIQMLNGHKSNSRISIQRLDEEMATIDSKLETWATHNLSQDKFSRVIKQFPANNHTTGKKGLTPESKSKDKLDNQFHKNLEQVSNLTINGDDSDVITCTYCAVNFADRTELRAHCQTESHQNVIMSDEGRDWKWRPPPRGYTADSYNLCESFSDNSVCHYGNQCVEAHGSEELNEWKERLEYRKMRLQRACEKELYGKTYTEQILEKWISAPSPDKIMKEKIDGVDETCSNELVTTVSSKVSKREWTFMFKTRFMLKAVALLQDAHRNHFTLKQVFPAEPRLSKRGQTSSNKVVEAELSSDQEWVVPNVDSRYAETINESSPMLEHRVKVVFSTDIYGTFRQAVVFDFGTEPVLVKHLCVDVIPVDSVDKIQEIRKEMVISTSKRWDKENSIIVPFETTLGPHLTTPEHLADEEREKDLLERYPCPRASTFTLTQTTITEKKLTKNNYRSRMHELLYVEEIARYEQVARYNLTTNLRITSNYLLTPSGMATSTAKYSHSGELFAMMTLGKDVSEDTSAGRLILNNCTSVYLANSDYTPSSDDEKRHVFEAEIEDKGKTVIYLKLSARCVAELKLVSDMEFSADIQFQLNRLSYCEWHQALDKIADFRIIFPEIYLEPSIPWTPKKQWADMIDPKLNSKQKEAVLAVTTPSHMPLPPILLIGPFGTGKTYTLASSIKQLLLQDESRILICTHSNSAADLYIKDYLHPWVEDGCEEARPLRVYYHKRWVATVNTTVQKYCLIELAGNVRNFRRPSKEDIMKYRIVVVTLNISMELASLDLPKGYFTHIFLDEAAQAMECEAIMPLALAGETTRIVLAGDHMQMSPELFSNFAKERKLHISLLERLYDHYPADFPCKILLCENYRAHEAITKFTSELFYDQKLIASGKQPKHDKFYPLTFFTTRGEDVQDKNSTAFYNNSEVYEVVERVCELKKKWPSTWGKISDQSIGIMTPYADQVFRIRSELRKRRMGGISVERVLNVQGKQFRAIFLSTVRTRRTCAGVGGGSQSDDMDYGFLSNSKLLNTAITRAQSLVAVVGDPLALCSIGRCRKVWERFIEICHQNKSLYGITWSLLRSQLDGVELKKTYVLNPLAPEFVPRAHQAEAYLRDQQSSLNMQQQQYQQQHHQPQYHHQQQQQQLQQQQQQQQSQQQYQLPIHHIGHTNFPPQNVLNQQIRALTNQPQMPQFAAPNFNSQQTNSTPQFPYSFYQIQQQQAHQHPHGQQPPIIRAPPQLAQQPQQQQQIQQQQQQPPPHPSSSQSNLWGPSPFGPNTANAWPKPTSQRPQQTSSQQPLHLNLSQTRQQVTSLRSPGSQNIHSQMSFMQNNKPPPPPYLVPQQQNHLRNLGDTISPGSAASMMPGQLQSSQDHISPLTTDMLVSIAARANQVHQQNAYTAAISKNQQRPNDQQSMHMDKDLQFLQNVHIPDRLIHHPQAQMGGLQMPATTPDFSNLLPPNMSFYDMSLEPKESQINWFMKLVETQGFDVAQRFADMLRQVSAMPQNKLNVNRIDQALQPMPNVQGYGPPQDLSFDTVMSNASMSQTLLSDLLGTKDLPLHQQPKQNPHLSQFQPNSKLHPMTLTPSNRNPVILNELGGYRMNDISQHYHQQQQQQQPQQPQQQQQQQSVPLYRRQAGQSFGSTGSTSSNNQSISSSNPDTIDNNIFDNLFNHHDDQFHGILPMHALSASLQQQNSFHLNHGHSVQQQQQQQQHHHHHRDDLLNRHNNSNTTTYASVLTQGTNQNQNMSGFAKQQQQQQASIEEKDPFAAIRELGQRSNGYYNYFQ